VPAPVLESFAAALYQELSPLALQDEANSWALAYYLASIGEGFQIVEDLARDTPTRPGWASLLDPQTAPSYALDWLGQFVGVEIPVGVTEQAKRDLIQDLAGWRRGTPGSIRAAVQLYLTGTKEVVITERDTSPYHFEVATRFSETPVAEWAATNLNQNGGAETNATGYGSMAAATVTRDTTVFKSGVASIKTVTPATSGAGVQYGIVTAQPVTVGKKYSFGVWVNAPLGQAMNLAIDWRTAADANVSTINQAFVGTGTWQYVKIDGATAPATSTKARTNINITTATIVTFYADEWQFEQNDAATPYVATNGATAARAAGTVNMLRAILTQKPAGLQFTYVVVPSWTYNDLDARAGTYDALDALYGTYDQMEDAP